MTKAEQAERAALEELNLTPEQLAARTRELDLKYPREAKGLASPNDDGSSPYEAPKATRAPRKDKGSHRVKTTDPQSTGALSREQASRGLDLVQTRDRLRVKWDAAIANEEDAAANFVDADAAVVAWFGEITSK